MFDVISIRPHAPDDNRFLVRPPIRGHFTAQGATAKLVMMFAYDAQESQIVNGPKWFAAKKWDMEAKSDSPAAHTVDESRRMLQNMFQERFALKIHRVTAPRPAYVLTVAKSGPKFKAAHADESTNIRIAGNSLTLQRAELARMTQFLATALGWPVVDRTGLSGSYDLSLQWDDEPVRQAGDPAVDALQASGNDHGSIFTAIQEQLGLRLESRRVPVELIVIDRIERPSPN